jgi:hydroxypyruvate isomerase
MPRFCANISMLFAERPFPERFQAAARAGFAAVEIQFPYRWDASDLAARARAAGVEVVQINLPAGDADQGDRGIACDPARAGEFREGVGRALEYAKALGCRQMNCLAGIAPPGLPEAALRETFVANVRWAAAELARAGMTLLVEPINTRTIPGFWLNRSTQALVLIEEAGAPNLRLQFDFFHVHVMEGDIEAALTAAFGRIGHLQVADDPGRHEPGTGAIDFPALFERVDRLGYRGWIGAEYVPSGLTEETLGWARRWVHEVPVRRNPW